MMMDTKNRYHDLAYGIVAPEPRFDGGYPEWVARFEPRVAEG
jgi:hypothetical protein